MKVRSKRAGTLLLLETLICHFFGLTTSTATNLAKNPPHQVNGILGRPGLLPVNLPRGKKARKVEWIYQTEGIWIATFEGEAFNRPPQSDRFGQRLQMADVTTLMIQELELEDSGIYMARVSLGTTGGRDQMFNLQVYEPVPELRVTPRLISKAPVGCNVTLRCQAFGKGGFSVSWETGDPPRTLEGRSDWYQLSANDSQLHVSWRPSFSDADFTCRASNPADQKAASFNMRSVCSSKGGNQSQRKWPVLVSLCVLLLIPAAVG